MTTYILNRHWFVLHRKNGEDSHSGNAALIKDPLIMRDWEDANQRVKDGAKVCRHCFKHGWPTSDPDRPVQDDG